MFENDEFGPPPPEPKELTPEAADREMKDMVIGYEPYFQDFKAAKAQEDIEEARARSEGTRVDWLEKAGELHKADRPKYEHLGGSVFGILEHAADTGDREAQALLDNFDAGNEWKPDARLEEAQDRVRWADSRGGAYKAATRARVNTNDAFIEAGIADARAHGHMINIAPPQDVQ